ncbi:hypothetical protein ACFSOZ_23685 [Mesorhizobium newzealandense]|uniref:Uncharacterized protein n=1 Tax=Mesorhizobium newzealandense TaxID=1300302 RepID=A0ABW4UEF1_9HYPH|nr:hypothetical protein [Mesorhizobium sophorae]
MTGNPHQPSGLGRGIQFIVNAEWTPEQAAAVFELLDDLRDCIWSRYAPHIQQFVRHQQAPDHQHPSSDEQTGQKPHPLDPSW